MEKAGAANSQPPRQEFSKLEPYRGTQGAGANKEWGLQLGVPTGPVRTRHPDPKTLSYPVRHLEPSVAGGKAVGIPVSHHWSPGSAIFTGHSPHRACAPVGREGCSEPGVFWKMERTAVMVGVPGLQVPVCYLVGS